MPCIYQIIRLSDESCVYVGSTSGELRKRIYSHRGKCKRRDYPLYRIVKAEGGWEAFDFVVLEEVDDNTDLLTLEKEYILHLNPEANRDMPIRTKEERRQ